MRRTRPILASHGHPYVLIRPLLDILGSASRLQGLHPAPINRTSNLSDHARHFEYPPQAWLYLQMTTISRARQLFPQRQRVCLEASPHLVTTTPDKNCKAGSNGSVGTSIDIPDIGDAASTPLSQDM